MRTTENPTFSSDVCRIVRITVFIIRVRSVYRVCLHRTFTRTPIVKARMKTFLCENTLLCIREHATRTRSLKHEVLTI
jgi:hypothetical protein